MFSFKIQILIQFIEIKKYIRVFSNLVPYDYKTWL